MIPLVLRAQGPPNPPIFDLTNLETAAEASTVYAVTSGSYSKHYFIDCASHAAVPVAAPGPGDFDSKVREAERRYGIWV